MSRLKAFKGSSFRYGKMSAMTVNFERDQPWLIIPKESLKLNLRSYDLTEWEDVGDNPDWGLDKVLDEDWESPVKERIAFVSIGMALHGNRHIRK